MNAAPPPLAELKKSRVAAIASDIAAELHDCRVASRRGVVKTERTAQVRRDSAAEDVHRRAARGRVAEKSDVAALPSEEAPALIDERRVVAVAVLPKPMKPPFADCGSRGGFRRWLRPRWTDRKK